MGVTFTKAFPAMSVGGMDLGAYEEGREERLPIWVAKILEEEGFVKISGEESQSLKSTDLYKLCWKEERNEGLSKLPSHFYPRLRRLLSSLNDAIKNNPTHTLLSEHRQSLMKAQDLVNCRLQKILHLARERNPLTPSLEMMEPEELALFNSIREDIEEWRKKIVSPE